MNLPYNRRDYNSIFEWLKNKAQELSEFRWTDFSEGDIGTIMIHLMSYIADMNNFSIDATTNELFLSEALERSSLMSILNLIGYKPRHYEAAKCLITISDSESDITSSVIPAGMVITDDAGSIQYTTIENQTIVGSKTKIVAYEGARKKIQFGLDSVNNGKIYLPDYAVAFNTVSMKISTVSKLENILRVEDVRFNSGDMCFSVHVDQDGAVYIQLPAYWKDIIDSSSSIDIEYLITNGKAGRVGKEVLTKIANVQVSSSSLKVINEEPSDGGYDPETVSELKINGPIAARTMYTIVTIKDFEEVSEFLEDITQVKALDYNDPVSGLIQPDDYYKVILYAVPLNPMLSSIYDEDGELNNIGKKFKDFIDERRLASLFIIYKDPDYIIPEIDIDLYMDENDLRKATVAESVKKYISWYFGRENLKIGESVYGSVIGTAIHTAFPFIEYCEVHNPEFNIVADKLQFIDMANAKYTIRVNDKQMYPIVKEENDMSIIELHEGYAFDYEENKEVHTITYVEKEGTPPVLPVGASIEYDGDVMKVRIKTDMIKRYPYKVV